MDNIIPIVMISLHIIFALYIIYIVRGVLKVPKLSTFTSSEKIFYYPLISIIVPACNEEETIKEGLQSLLNLQYPHLEFIIVNDRSSDNTGQIIQEISLNDKRVKYIDIKSLPDGWIGKVHAIWQGSKKANGEWLLFTDADILYHPKTLRYVLNYMAIKPYDHLTVAPTMITKSIWLRGIILMLKLNLFVFLRPQFMHKKSSTAGMGIGAFNMIKKDVYEKIGTHEAIRLCVDDDVMLGKLVKRKGYTPSFILGQEFIEVEWYKDLQGMFRGLEKNALPPFLYSMTLMFLSFIGTALLYIGPYISIYLFDGVYKLIVGVTLLITLVFFMMNDYFSKQSIVLAVIFPFVFLLFIVLLLYGGLKVRLRGGVQWRDTFYPIKLLKKHNKIV